MTYKLFIDDERHPVTDDWVVARSSRGAAKCVIDRGMPVEISFDHDLGGEDTSRVFINWLIDEIIEGRVTFPENFTYSVHSQNPIGAAWIKGTMDRLIKEFK